MSAWNSNGLASWIDGDTVFISVVFSWKLPDAFQLAIWYKSQGYKVKTGGPGVWVRPKYLASVAEIGGEYPDAILHHNPFATVSSRGCPVGCSFCLVPPMEGKEFTLLPEFIPRPILCDNNLSALPVDYQDFIIEKYQKANVQLLDANNGFEPRSFDEDTYHRWKSINRGPWRFGYDEIGETDEVYRMTRILKDVIYNKKRVFVLLGNEPVDSCLERIRKVIEWDCEPHCQPMIALNSLRKKPIIRYDWTEQKLKDMARWANKWLWRTMTFQEYNPRHEKLLDIDIMSRKV